MNEILLKGRKTLIRLVADPEGVRGVQTPLEPKLFHFHGEFLEKLVKLQKLNPPQLKWTPDPKLLDPPMSSILFYLAKFKRYYGLSKQV